MSEDSEINKINYGYSDINKKNSINLESEFNIKELDFFLKKRDYKAAIKYINQKEKCYPKDLNLVNIAFLLFEHLEDFNKTNEYSNKFIQLQPNSWKGYIYRAKSLLILVRNLNDQVERNIKKSIGSLNKESKEFEALLNMIKPLPINTGSYEMNLPKTNGVKKLNGSISSFNSFGKKFTFFIANPNDSIQKEYLRGNLYEKEELEIIKKNFNNAKYFLDIGANVGNHSIFFKKVLEAKEVLTFEANPIACDLLKININLNNISEAINTNYLGYAISSKNEELSLEIPKNNLGGARRTKDLTEESFKVNSIKIDDLNLKKNFSFVKIDVEGMELEVLEGMKDFIKNFSPRIFIEVDNANLIEFHNWCKRYRYKIIEKFRRYPVNTNFMCAPFGS